MKNLGKHYMHKLNLENLEKLDIELEKLGNMDSLKCGKKWKNKRKKKLM